MKPTKPVLAEDVVTSLTSIRTWRQEVTATLERVELRLASLERRDRWVILWSAVGASVPTLLEWLL